MLPKRTSFIETAPVHRCPLGNDEATMRTRRNHVDSPHRPGRPASRSEPAARAGGGRSFWIRAAGLAGAAAIAAAGAATPGCASEEELDTACVPLEQLFAEQIWGPILSQKCIGCHNPLGLAKSSKMVLKSSSEAGFLDANLAIVKEVASFEKDGTSILLLKPTKTIDHGGGVQIEKDSPEYQALAAFVAQAKAPEACAAQPEVFFADVVLASPVETLRKATIALAGRLPTEEEKELVASGGMPALDAVLDTLMREDAFYDRLKEIYNDRFLTDRYIGGEEAVNLIDDEDSGYDPRWYENLDDPGAVKFYGAKNADHLYDLLRSQTNVAIAREPLELIAYVVRNDRPFGEIVTADYMVVNPFSAKAWSVKGVEFENEADPREWREARREGFPHAGVLTSPMFLSRHPTTPTNRNRHRARMVYEWFLGTDILKTAERPIDPTKITDFNPTMNNPACTVCHAALDPIAGTFHSFDELGRYSSDDPWYEDMRPPGFGNESVPYEEFPSSIRWVAQRIADDPRFALSAVYVLFEGLTGQTPLVAPADPKEPGYAPAFQAYLAQYRAFAAIAKEYEAANGNLKAIVKGIVKSPYFRAKNGPAATGNRAVELAEIGTGRFSIPEQLNRKIKAVLGYPWRRDVDDRDFLLDANQYRLLYGGIDSNDVTRRIKEPNGVMANIAERMANEMSCWVVPREFTRPKEERRLFPLIETSYAPEDANGFPVEPAIAAIKANIRHLHEHVLGESLPEGDPEIERTYRLFFETWKEGVEKMALEDEEEALSDELPWECRATKDWWTGEELPEERRVVDDPQYTVRAWMAVTTYLLADHAFLYE